MEFTLSVAEGNVVRNPTFMRFLVTMFFGMTVIKKMSFRRSETTEESHKPGTS